MFKENEKVFIKNNMSELPYTIYHISKTANNDNIYFLEDFKNNRSPYYYYENELIKAVVKYIPMYNNEVK